MDKGAGCYITQLIEGNGTFNADGLDNFVKQVKLGECGVSYAIVAVMGPQSSGKSTLLNHLFDTDFQVMNANMGRLQTTKGVWIAKCTSIEPCTIAMDIEGTDGQERGQDDTAFEKQSALFAIAVADIVIINMWYHDIGREQAANRPLLKTVFQVMLRLLVSPRKTTLLFVIRDYIAKTPLEILKDQLWDNIHKIWDSVPKPEAHKHSKLSKFFNVKIIALSSYEEKEEEFKEQVANLRQTFFQSIAPDVLARYREGVVPASGFSLSAKKIWEEVKENKVLKLTGHANMVATVLCEEIAKENYSSFIKNKDWLELEEKVKSHIVPDFGKKLSSLLDNCLYNYDKEAVHYDGDVQSEKREPLNEKLVQLVQPTYKLMFEHIRSEALHNFKTSFNNTLNEGHGFAVTARVWTKKSIRRFDERCEDATCKQANWDTTEIRDKFVRDLDSHITEVRAAKLDELTALKKEKLNDALGTPVEAHLKKANDKTWPAIKILFRNEIKKVVEVEYSSALSNFEMDEQEKRDKILNLKNFGRGIVEKKTREVARNAIYLAKDRFVNKFCFDDNSNLRDWSDVDLDIQAIADKAVSEGKKVMSVLTATSLDNKTDTILTSETWDESLVTDYKLVLEKCKSDIIKLIGQAKDVQQKHILKNSDVNAAGKGDIIAAGKGDIIAAGNSGVTTTFKAAISAVVDTAIDILIFSFKLWISLIGGQIYQITM